MICSPGELKLTVERGGSLFIAGPLELFREYWTAPLACLRYDGEPDERFFVCDPPKGASRYEPGAFPGSARTLEEWVTLLQEYALPFGAEVHQVFDAAEYARLAFEKFPCAATRTRFAIAQGEVSTLKPRKHFGKGLMWLRREQK